MKTYKNLFREVVTFENLLAAAEKASKGKANKRAALQFNKQLEDNLLELQSELRSKSYQPGKYNAFHIFEPKKRYISAAPFRDRVVHHAICHIIEPLFGKTFIFHSYANRKDKGTHKAIRIAQSYIQSRKYILKCDIQKYFPSIDHAILKQEIRWKIADPDLLNLIDTIIDSSNPQEPVDNIFPGDDLFTWIERPKGLPLGNLTSQFFANLYLNKLDHYIKQHLRIKPYIRYVDDFILADDSKDRLHLLKQQISYFLTILRLKLHPKKCHLHRSDKGITFLGQKIYPFYRLLKKENVRHFCKKMNKWEGKLATGLINNQEFNSSVQGWNGHAKQADTFKLRKSLEKKYIRLNIKLIGS